MWVGRFVVSLCVLLIASSALAIPGWMTDFEAAISRARNEGKPLIVDFGAPSCPACRQLERETLSDSSVQQQLASFVRVYVNGNEKTQLREQFGVQYYPTLVFMSPSGKVLHREVGFVDSNQLNAAVSRVVANVRATETKALVAGAKNGSPRQQSAGDSSGKNGMKSSLVAQGKTGVQTKGANLYDMVAARQAAARPAVALAPAVAEGESVRVEFAANAASEAGKSGFKNESGLGGAEGTSRQLAQALPVPKSIETPAPLLNVPSTSTPSLAEQKTTEKPAATPAATPAGTASTSAEPEKSSKELPESVKKLQQMGSSTKASSPATQQSEQKVSETPAKPTQTPSSAKTAESSKAPAERPSSASSRKPSTKPQAETAAKPSESATRDTVSKDEAAAKSAQKKTTPEDIERWFQDAESKLLSGYKKEAQAMYAKVVNSDPTNMSGKSDLAFIKMVALMVDRDDDLLRKKAYDKIREFLARYPNSPYRDYYTVVRATLAADLGNYAEAHALLDRFPEEFPNSRYEELARTVWQSLPTKFDKPATKPTESAKSRSASSSQKSTAGSKSSSAAKPSSTKASSQKGTSKATDSGAKKSSSSKPQDSAAKTSKSSSSR